MVGIYRRVHSNNLRMNLVRSLLAWYAASARNFPWRTPNVSPYVVLVSETMLQQTQTSRVAEALPRFLERFPTIHDLAQATNADVVRQWKGMGYNSRALRLRNAAQAVVREHNGVIPSSVEVLRMLPGVGPYTSAAIACFGYNQRVVVIDVNVRRVYSRWMRAQQTTADVSAEFEVHAYAEAIIPHNAAADWHHAVMDLGSTICTARSPGCSVCPVALHCASAGALVPAQKPRKSEPMFRGTPRRIWRGRIIEALRRQPAPISPVELQMRVMESPLTTDEMAWFEDVLLRLVSDGLVAYSGADVVLAQ